ncbi:hypothetical protein EDD21DRAFT_380416, partial [Dissophora ornata]
MKQNNPILIPELVELIAGHLPPHSLTTCLLVNHDWNDAFLPYLYKHIVVFDFDFYSRYPEYCFGARTAGKMRPAEIDVSYGGSQVFKYTHFTKTITTANVHSFKYLGVNCTNLTHASIVSQYRDKKIYSAYPLLPDERADWHEYFKTRTRSQTADLWVELIERNPSLVYVRLDLEEVSQGLDRIAKALSNLSQLQEISLYKPTHRNVVELFLDHCPNITRFEYSAVSPRVAFSPSEPARPTQVRHLKFDYPSTCEPRVLAYLVRRCPNLERLSLPFNPRAELLSTVATTIRASECRATLKHLDFDGNITSSPGNPELESLLLAYECLASISFTRARLEFDAAFYLRDPGLRDRLQVFTYSPTFPGRIFQTVAVLELCPNLSVFQIDNASVRIDRFLSIDWCCQESLKSLRISINMIMAQAVVFERYREIWERGGVKEGDHGAWELVVLDSLTQLRGLEVLELEGVPGLSISENMWNSSPPRPDEEAWIELKKQLHLKVFRLFGTRYNM